MTLVMYDSITPATLPAGADAYLGYVNGEWPTCPVIKNMFPGARFVCLSVTGATTQADGIDVENGDYTQAQGVQWMQQAIAAGAPARPVWYESASQMDSALSELAAGGVTRSSVRLLSAHYGWQNVSDLADPANNHICGPTTCGLTSTAMDGTQWTDSAVGVGGALIDQSALADGFFTTQTQGGSMLIYGPGNAVYLLDGGKLHHIVDVASLALYQAAGLPSVGSTGNPITQAELDQLLTDFPPGQPELSVPPVSVTFPTLYSTGTITPEASVTILAVDGGTVDPATEPS